VVELTQTLQERTAEKKRLQLHLAELEQQLLQWTNRHEEADTRAKQFQLTLQTTEVEVSRLKGLLSTKIDVEKKLEEAIAKATEKEVSIQILTEDILRQASQLEIQQKMIDAVPARNQDDNSVIMTLKNEVSSLREQLNRSNALNSLTRGSRADPPLSPRFSPALRLGEPNGHPNTALSQSRGHQRRHSSAGVFSYGPLDDRTSIDELMINVKRTQALNPRAVSVAFNGEDTNYWRGRANGLSDIHDNDPAEEKIRLMQDMKRLDEDVLDGLIRGLKIPGPSLTNPSAVKEILFPANLISLVTNEMWKYGLISESERFLANVMQSIQTHVMVRSTFHLKTILCLIHMSSLLMEKMPSYRAFFGCRMSTKCFLSFALLRAICFKALDRERKGLYADSTGTTMKGLSLSSDTISTVWSTTFITHGCLKQRRNFRRWSFPL
jgi:myosin-5